MIEAIYSGVIFIATLVGASAGLGGGIIIKPVLDFIGMHDLDTINFLSTCAVFTMAIYSTIKQIRNKVKFDYLIILLIAIGSVVGGSLGSAIFRFFMDVMNHNLLKFIQSSILTILLLIVIVNVNIEHKNLFVKNKAIIVLIGIMLGTISSFLGIGGGPVNVAVFVLFFSVDIKTATVYSIATILFSQASTLLTIACTRGFLIFDLSLLFYVLPMSILGGIVGTKINFKSNAKQITKIFNLVSCFILILSIYNAIVAIT
ncbi:MAG: sulfite exporter TauE/SafE family protein [Longicatena sp.]